MPNSTESQTDAEALLTAQAHRQALVGRVIVDLTALRALPPDVLLRAIAAVVTREVRRLVDVGWRPSDMAHVRARRLDGVPGLCLFDAVAEATEADARLRVDAEWTGELREVVAGTPGGTPRPTLTQPFRDARWPPDVLLGYAMDLLAAIVFLPRLPDAAPLRTSTSPAGTETAMLIKVRALLAKAERTEFEHEAEAFTAKAQALMARHSIDEAMLTTSEGPTPGTALQRIWLDAPYVRPKFSLVHAVAAANRCEALLNTHLDLASVVGMSSDVRAAVLLATSLQLQATRAVTRARPDPRDEWVSVKTYRRSFLLAFAGRIGERLRAATADAEAGVDRDRLLPVLADRKALVERAVAEAFPRTKTLRRSSPVEASGWAAGRAAADLARLGNGPALGSTG